MGELHNSPRIPVVSRPVFSKSRFLSSPPPSKPNIIFPLPKEVYQLPLVQGNSSSFRYSSSSSEDETFSPTGKNDNRFTSDSRSVISVIKKHVTDRTQATTDAA